MFGTTTVFSKSPKKYMKIKLSIVVLLLSTSSIFAQEKPKAVQIDEFGKVTCEDLLARTNGFGTQLSNDPSALGVVIIRYDPSLVSRARWYRKLITGSLLNYSDATRLKIIQDPTASEIGGQFWLVPAGANEPPYQGILWPDETFDLSKPFLYDSSSDEDVCSAFTPQTYADLIKSNPSVRGRIVIHPMFRRYQYETANQWAKTFVEKYKVPRNRFKIVFGKRSDPGDVEFWIVPVNKKK